MLRAHLFVLLSLVCSYSAGAAVFTVNSTGDDGDANFVNDSCGTGNFIFLNGILREECTLRAAIEEANLGSSIDTIQFSQYLVPEIDGAIYITSGGLFATATPLPEVTRPIILDGTSAPTYNANNPAQAPVVTLSGFWQSANSHGLRLTEGADGSQILGIRIVRFPGDGILLDGADSVRVDRCEIGIFANGGPNGNGDDGIEVRSTSTFATIGRSFSNLTGFTGYGNVISDNGGDGVHVAGDSARIAGNLIGTDRTGTLVESPLGTFGNGRFGVFVDATADQVEVGRIGTTLFPANQFASGNVISGNSQGGVRIEGPNALVYANKVGTDVSGAIALGNGIFPGIETRAASTTIGDEFHAGAGNLVSGNWSSQITAGNGLGFADAATIAGNQIGVDAGGSLPLAGGPGASGIALIRGSGIEIDANVVGGLEGHGIWVFPTVTATVRNNDIGTNSSGVDLGNGLAGVFSSGNVFMSGNIVGFNGGDGVHLAAGAEGSTLVLNSIGADAAGNLFGNADDGIHVATSNIDLGSSGGFGNIVGDNEAGVHLTTGAVGVVIQDNAIGTNASGADLGNRSHGLWLEDATDTTIGSDASAASGLESSANRVAFNGGVGVLIEGDSLSLRNAVRGNSIFDNLDLGMDLGGDGPTVNDSLDLDSGPNALLNRPVLDSDQTELQPGGDIAIAYSLNTPSLFHPTAYPLTVDFYLADSDREEPELYLGSDVYSPADEGTLRSLTLNPAVSVDESDYLVALVTDSGGNTSEVSSAVPVPEPVFAMGLIVGGIGLLAARRRRS